MSVTVAAWRRLAFNEIDSTNAEAMRLAANGERGPVWITARWQTRGRGRSGRSWASANESVAATLLLEPGCAAADLPHLSLVAGVAAHDAIRAALPRGALPGESNAVVRLKWPNDVMIEGAKACGILVESTLLGGQAVAVIGTGINITGPGDVAGRTVASLAQHGAMIGADAVAEGLAVSLAGWLAVWDQGRGFAKVREAWLERAGPIGETMTVNVGGDVVAGRFAGLDASGALLLDDEAGARRTFAFGDVALAAPRV